MCAFGCGRPAIKQLKNGKPVCGESANQCPVMRLMFDYVWQTYGRNLLGLYE
jgi:hypothetical protein